MYHKVTTKALLFQAVQFRFETISKNQYRYPSQIFQKLSSQTLTLFQVCEPEK